MRVTTGYERRPARIEVVPLFDVIFLLLTFFIYAMLSMTFYRDLHVDLPIGSGDSEAEHPLVITLTADNTLSIDGRAVTMGEAVAAATALDSGTHRVQIRGDRHAALGAGVALLSALREANVSSVSFQVQPEP